MHAVGVEVWHSILSHTPSLHALQIPPLQTLAPDVGTRAEKTHPNHLSVSSTDNRTRTTRRGNALCVFQAWEFPICHLEGAQFPLKIVDALVPGRDVLLHAVVMHRVALSIAVELGGERARAWWAECVKPISSSEVEEHAPQVS